MCMAFAGVVVVRNKGFGGTVKIGSMRWKSSSGWASRASLELGLDAASGLRRTEGDLRPYAAL